MKTSSAEHILSLIAENYPGLVTYVSKDLVYEFTNNEYFKWFNLPFDSVVGKHVDEILSPEEINLRTPYIQRALKGEKVKFASTLIHRKLGVRDVEQIYNPDIAEDGTVRGIITFSYDITEQKKAEREAQDNEARFRSLNDAIPQLVWMSDDKGELLWLNERWCETTGTTLQENLGSGWLKVVHPDDRPATLKNWLDGIGTLEGKAAEYRLRLADGTYRWHMGRAVPIHNNEGKIVRWVGTTTDIEEQKNAATIAEREREKIYSLFMQAPIAIAVTRGPDHILQMVNPSGAKFFPGIDVIGKATKDVYPELDSQGMGKILDKIFATGKGEFFPGRPVRITYYDGSFVDTFQDLFYEPIKDENGNTTGLLHISVDVTEQINAMKRAEESEALFRNYVESMPQMAFIAEPSGKITYFSQQWETFFGIPIDELHKWRGDELHHPDDLQDAIQLWEHSLRTGEVYQIEYRLRRKDGVYRWHLGRAVPMRDANGNITQWVGTNTDIHDQKEIESHQSRLLQVLDSSSDFIGIADKNGNGIYLNRAGMEMIGIKGPQEEPSGILDIFFDEDKDFVKNVILPTTLQKGKWIGDLRFKHRKTGKACWVHYNSFITRDETTGEFTGFATVSRDISELKNKEKKLEEALKARDHFLSIASHELKTPLTSLKLQSQLTLRNIKANKEINYDKLVSMALQNSELVDRLTRLIDDMLDVSRINTGKLRLHLSTHEMGDIVREAVFRMSVLFEAAGIKLPSIAFDEKYFGEWDRFRIEQVIGNLLTNAIRYGKGNDVDIRLKREDHHVVLSIEDHGYGISPEDQHRIFERFERAINSSEVSGMGLGLYISKEIVEAHGGKIWVDSELNIGSTFYVSLPLAKEQEKYE